MLNINIIYILNISPTSFFDRGLNPDITLRSNFTPEIFIDETLKMAS